MLYIRHISLYIRHISQPLCQTSLLLITKSNILLAAYRSTEEIFALFISIAFTVDACKGVTKRKDHVLLNT